MKDIVESSGEKFEIDVKGLFPKFKTHLDQENNSRILFSGKFGIGKTTFLNKFLEQGNGYEVFHLYPVNYQISSNEDVIEFLKYDILVELFNKFHKNPENKDKQFFEKNDYLSLIGIQRLLYLWGKNNVDKIAKTGAGWILSLGEFLTQIPLSQLNKPTEDTIDLITDFWNFKEEIEAGLIEDFLTSIKAKNISETDLISEMIKNKIETQKKQRKKGEQQLEDKKSVLILDDLERIDPEHIFRILNIFSAHFDLKNEPKNKFDFDKIILVADYKNIQSIFHHKYGENTDFGGYIDKFYTSEVFEFKNEEIIEEYVYEIISQFKLHTKQNKFKTLDKLPSASLKLLLEDILTYSLYLDGKEKINLRQLLKGLKSNFLLETEIRIDRGVASTKTALNFGINILISIFSGSNYDFLHILEKLKDNLKYRKYNEDNENIYDDFTRYLLNCFPFKKYTQSINWESPCSQKTYKIYFNNQDHEKIKEINIIDKHDPIKTERINIEELFFDLLISYIKSGHHNKK